MRLYDIIDEQGRYCGFKATTEPQCGSVLQTHGVSYLHARRVVGRTKDEMSPVLLREYARSGVKLPYTGWLDVHYPKDRWLDTDVVYNPRAVHTALERKVYDGKA